MTKKSLIPSKEICFVCEEILDKDIDRKFMVALERPYANLYIHYDCWQKSRGNYPGFILEKWELIKSILKRRETTS